DLAALEASTWWNDGLVDEADLPGPVQRLWAAARGEEQRAATFLLFVRFASMLAWEQEWAVDGIRRVVDLLEDLVDEDHRDEVRAALRLLTFLTVEFDVESASLGGTAQDWALAAETATHQAASLLSDTTASSGSA